MLVKLTLAFSLSLGPPAWAASTSVTEGTGTTATTTAPQLITSPSINPAAQQGKSSQSGGQMANMIAGIAMLAMCVAMQPPNPVLCAMGAMAMAQSGADKDAANQSGATQLATTSGAPLGGGSGTGATSEGSTTASTTPTYQAIDDSTASLKDKEAAKAGLQALADAGYKVSAAGVTTSNGNTIPASSFSSSGGMLAAGLDPNQVKEAQDAVAKVNADLAKYKGMAAVAEGVGGGGGASTGEASTSTTDTRKLASFVNPFAMSEKEKTAMIAGKTVTFDGEPIGVKGDNIFDMVHVAYQRKTAGKHFIETDHDPELNQVRAPASLTKSLPTLSTMPRK